MGLPTEASAQVGIGIETPMKTAIR